MLKKADAQADGDIAPEPGASAKNAEGVQAALTEAATTDAGEIVKLNPYRYAAYRYDAETELYFLESRYYDSWSNRFISRDSYIGELDKPLTLNRYVYALGNPVSYIDDTGDYPVLSSLVSCADFKRLNYGSRAYVLQAILIGLGYSDASRATGRIDARTQEALNKTRAGIAEQTSAEWVGPLTYARLLREYARVRDLGLLGFQAEPTSLLWPALGARKYTDDGLTCWPVDYSWKTKKPSSDYGWRKDP